MISIGIFQLQFLACLVARRRGWLKFKLLSGVEDIRASTRLSLGGVLLWKNGEIGLPIDGGWSTSVP